MLKILACTIDNLLHIQTIADHVCSSVTFCLGDPCNKQSDMEVRRANDRRENFSLTYEG
jgi:hypothetical protein